MLKNGPVLYLGLKLTIHVIKSRIISRDSPFKRVYFLILIHIRVCTGCKANNRCEILLATVQSLQFFLLNRGETYFWPVVPANMFCQTVGFCSLAQFWSFSVYFVMNDDWKLARCYHLNLTIWLIFLLFLWSVAYLNIFIILLRGRNRRQSCVKTIFDDHTTHEKG